VPGGVGGEVGPAPDDVGQLVGHVGPRVQGEHAEHEEDDQGEPLDEQCVQPAAPARPQAQPDGAGTHQRHHQGEDGDPLELGEHAEDPPEHLRDPAMDLRKRDEGHDVLSGVQRDEGEDDDPGGTDPSRSERPQPGQQQRRVDGDEDEVGDHVQQQDPGRDVRVRGRPPDVPGVAVEDAEGTEEPARAGGHALRAETRTEQPIELCHHQQRAGRDAEACPGRRREIDHVFPPGLVRAGSSPDPARTG
jgi:hypothetical protein